MGDDFILVKMALFRCLSNKGVKGLHIEKKKSCHPNCSLLSSEFPFSLKTKKEKFEEQNNISLNVIESDHVGFSQINEFFFFFYYAFNYKFMIVVWRWEVSNYVSKS